jgi:polysaccharide export outer membrane protein
LADAPVLQQPQDPDASQMCNPASLSATRNSVRALLARWRLFLSILGALLVVCLLCCLLAPRQYQAKAELALRTSPASALSFETSDISRSAGAMVFGDPRQETLANVLRSEQLAWRVILEQKLYQAPGFAARFEQRFPGFRPDSSNPEAEAWLLERFQRSLYVRTIPRTLMVEVRFRSRDPRLSVDVLNSLIGACRGEETEIRVLATAQATSWLNEQLIVLKGKADGDEQELADFQKEHGLLMTPDVSADGKPVSSQHVTAILEVDELGRQLVTASSERILREAEFRAASQGDPELVLASDPRLESESGGLSVAAFRQIHQKHSELEQERAQLAAEHGPNFPRVEEIRRQLDDLDRQLQSEDSRLRDRFRSAWQTAADREGMLRKALVELTGEGQNISVAAAQYQNLRAEAEGSRALYVRMQNKVEEAGLAAGIDDADFWVVDPPHIPAKPVAPNLPLYMAITLFAGTWLAGAAVYLVDSAHSWRTRRIASLLVVLAAACALHAQAPTPNTSGLPTGVVKLPSAADTRSVANPKGAPLVWNAPASSVSMEGASPEASVPGPIAAGETLEVAEYHTPEFHSVVRVTAEGQVTLPLIGDIKVAGLDEATAARVIADTLVAKGMLLHPQVTVLVTAVVGQDVTVLGEVARPGVYPFGAHHRLLDLISAAAGLNVTAGGLVNILHRDDETPQMVTLDFNQAGRAEQNPELRPGDTVQVSRAGLVYVVGDVNRPGGFTLDLAQRTTVLQALSLAWGPSQNAALTKAVLIHASNDGRTVTVLNLKRMLRGQDPDIPVAERDILFVPDSTAKNLWNRTMESAIQSAAGVSIYAGMVYSQRF